MPSTMTPTPVQPSTPMPSEPSPSPASPVVQTLDEDDDEDIAEDQPMPAQSLLPARRPRAPSIAAPQTAVEARVEVEPLVVPVEAPTQVVPVAPAIDASSEGAVAPASKKARQYDLASQQPWQPLPHLQPPLHPPALPASSSSPAALPAPTTTSSPTEPEGQMSVNQGKWYSHRGCHDSKSLRIVNSLRVVTYYAWHFSTTRSIAILMLPKTWPLTK